MVEVWWFMAMKRLLPILVLCVTNGCATHKPFPVTAGMTKAEVEATVGAPQRMLPAYEITLLSEQQAEQIRISEWCITPLFYSATMDQPEVWTYVWHQRSNQTTTEETTFTRAYHVIFDSREKVTRIMEFSR